MLSLSSKLPRGFLRIIYEVDRKHCHPDFIHQQIEALAKFVALSHAAREGQSPAVNQSVRVASMLLISTLFLYVFGCYYILAVVLPLSSHFLCYISHCRKETQILFERKFQDCHNWIETGCSHLYYILKYPLPKH